MRFTLQMLPIAWRSATDYKEGQWTITPGGALAQATEDHRSADTFDTTHWIVSDAQGVGPAGPQGAAGAQGPQGAIGPQGIQGTGSQGPQGPQGAASNIAGPQGPQGAVGPQGSQGSQGPQGAASTVAGPQGPQGASGSPGATAASGVSVDPSGLVVVTTTNVQAALAQLDAAAASQSSVPSGPAGGALAGTYPNPAIAPSAITDGMIAANAGIASTKVALVNDGAFTSPTQRTASFLQHKRRRATGAIFYGPLGARAPGSLVVAAGLCYYIPIHVERPLTLGPTFNLNVLTAATAGNAKIAVYADDGQGRPTGAPIGTSNTLSIATTGIKGFSLSVPITIPDLYWIALLIQNDVTGSPAVGCFSQDYHFEQMYQSGLTTVIPNPVTNLLVSGAATWPLITHAVSAVT